MTHGASTVLPYFVSIKPQARGVLVNVRSGPGQHYPLEWQIVQAYWPLEVLHTFEHWRHIRDADGSTGWVHKSMISGKRFVAFLRQVPLYKKADFASAVLAQIAQSVIAQPLACEEMWCRVRIDNLQGWVERAALWGVSPQDSKF